jgi:hypothetical protein
MMSGKGLEVTGYELIEVLSQNFRVGSEEKHENP